MQCTYWKSYSISINNQTRPKDNEEGNKKKIAPEQVNIERRFRQIEAQLFTKRLESLNELNKNKLKSTLTTGFENGHDFVNMTRITQKNGRRPQNKIYEGTNTNRHKNKYNEYQNNS